ncbi:MAG: pilus assembly protein [Streptosporangiales bacterium]|nr:pilus assembly protein [Streptosporangiales bacterium]
MRGSDRGTMAMFMVIFAFFVLVLGGLVLDGGMAIQARQRATDVAEQAARAAANDIDVAHLRATGAVRINDTACGRAAAFVAQDGVTTLRDCAVSAGSDAVEVEVGLTVEPQLLSVIPGLSFHMSGSALARPETGVVVP